MIPPEKSDAVTRGLREAFGVTEFEDICRVTGGLTTSLVFRIVVRGSPFLLKIITRTYGQDTMTRMFTCMQAAAQAGLAPRIWYTSIEDQVSITDFLTPAPFPVADALLRMPALLRALHALPPFPPVPDHLNTSCMFLLNPGPALDGFLTRFQAANIVPPADLQEVLARYAQVSAVYPRGPAEMVSSHNDLKPENILFDGRRVWLVDWEAAFRNDRYSDLAVIANFVAPNAADENLYLQEYFGQPPDPYQAARFFLMQQVVHLFHAMAYLLIGWSGQPLYRSADLPAFHDFLRRNWTGEVTLAGPDMRITYGRLHWERLLHNIRVARFDEALQIVADRHPPRRD